MSDQHDFYDDFHRESAEMLELNYDEVVTETPRAWLIRFPMDDDLNNKEEWLPKSMCHLHEPSKTIEVPEWLVYEKEIEDYEL